MVEWGMKIQKTTQCVYGGVEYRVSTNAVRDGNDIIIATPGRLEDMVYDHRNYIF